MAHECYDTEVTRIDYLIERSKTHAESDLNERMPSHVLQNVCEMFQTN